MTKWQSGSRLRANASTDPRPTQGRNTEAQNGNLHSLIATMGRDFDLQTSCPLFCAIPPELRNRIFLFALTSYDDKLSPYPDNSYYHRPGYHYRHRIDTALLATCRRIYNETHDLPLSLNEHVFWCFRGPPIHDVHNPKPYFERLTLEQQEAVRSVHFFAQLYWLEGSFRGVCNITQMQPKWIKITVRHSDWWYWESNSPLMMKEGWGDNLKAIKSLEKLEVELETMERNKNQLETIVKTMLKWRFSLDHNRILTTEGTTVVRDRYIGQGGFSERPAERGYTIHYDTSLGRWIHGRKLDATRLAYTVITLNWVLAAAN